MQTNVHNPLGDSDKTLNAVYALVRSDKQRTGPEVVQTFHKLFCFTNECLYTVELDGRNSYNVIMDAHTGQFIIGASATLPPAQGYNWATALGTMHEKCTQFTTPFERYASKYLHRKIHDINNVNTTFGTSPIPVKLQPPSKLRG